ncbi:Structural maintenance of chromosomes protein 4, partial [Spiromyces aspiralis]
CIEFLRKNNIGRAKFIILDQLPKGKAFERPSWAPKNVTRLFDLINPSDERFLPAFFHATGNTLVADNLTEARKIAYGGRRVMRVVTLDGNLISASGSMTGGGNRQIKGAMSSRPINQGMTPTKLATLEAKRENMEAAWREASTRLTHYEERLKQLNKQKSELEGLLPRLEMDLKLVHEQIQGHKKRIKHLHAESQSPKEEDQKRFEELARAEADHEAAIAELKNQCTQIEGAIKELQEKIMQVGGVQLRVQKTKVDDLRIRINTLNEQISSWERSRIKSEQDMARLERSLAKREAEKEELTQQLNEIAKSIEANTASAVEVKEHSDKVQAKADDKRDEMDRIKAELDELNESYAEMRTRELDMKHQMNSAEKQLAEARKSSNYWRSELDRLELQPLTDLDRDGDTDTDGMEIESQGDDQDAEANK